VASSRELFRDTAPACDACGDELQPSSDDDLAHAPVGEGALLWWRDGRLREEKRPLCPPCAAAIGLTALTRWAIEEEGG
jgi:hypothetical protein